MQMVNIADANKAILGYLNAKTHWGLFVESHSNFIAAAIEEKFYKGCGERFIAIMYPYKGTMLMMYFADKRELSAADLHKTIVELGVDMPRGAVEGRDIVFIADYPYLMLATEMLTALESDQILDADEFED